MVMMVVGGGGVVVVGGDDDVKMGYTIYWKMFSLFFF